MGSITLDDRDAAILECLRRSDADVEMLAASASCERSYVRDRLPELADNGLVRRVDDDGDAYSLTEDGQRVTAGSPAGAMDDRIDTPEEVDRAIESLDLRPDREEAVRNAFSVLRYWGEALPVEIVDAVYSENPAGFESMNAWWDEFVRERLAALPRVEASDSAGEPWRYTGTPTVEQDTDDGRQVSDDGAVAQSSVKYALERADLSGAERSAVRTTFAVLAREGEASGADLREEVFPDHDAGYDDPEEWWTDLVRETFESLPGVERADGDAAAGDDAETVWRYQQVSEGPMSSGPGADVPDEPLGPEDGNDE